MAVMLKLKPIPAIKISRKSIRCSDAKIPVRINGMAIPALKLSDSERASPAYCPRISDLLRTG